MYKHVPLDTKEVIERQLNSSKLTIHLDIYKDARMWIAFAVQPNLYTFRPRMSKTSTTQKPCSASQTRWWINPNTMTRRFWKMTSFSFFPKDLDHNTLGEVMKTAMEEMASATEAEIRQIIFSGNSKCRDPLPTITQMVSTSITSWLEPTQLKTAIVSPLPKKPIADLDEFKSYRPFSKLPFISKIVDFMLTWTIIHWMPFTNQRTAGTTVQILLWWRLPTIFSVRWIIADVPWW